MFYILIVHAPYCLSIRLEASSQRRFSATASMAPKIAQGALPKAAQEFKEMILALGGSVDADGVAKACPKQRNKAAVAMKTLMNEESKTTCSALGSDEARHQWIADYLLDPKVITCKGTNTIARRSEAGTKAKIVWLTMSELGGPMYMNSQAEAKIAITSMKSRPHATNAALATAGILQYRHEVIKEVSNQMKEEKVEAEAEAAMDQESFQGIWKHMSNSDNPGEEPTKPTKKARKEPKAIEDKDRTPEKIAWKAQKQ